jgi:hypothetical protein
MFSLGLHLYKPQYLGGFAFPNVPEPYFGADTFALYNPDAIGFNGNVDVVDNGVLYQRKAVDLTRNPLGLDLTQDTVLQMPQIVDIENIGRVWVSEDATGSRFLKSLVLGTGIQHRHFTVIMNYYKLSQAVETEENVLRLTDTTKADAMRYQSRNQLNNDRQNAQDSANVQHVNDVANTAVMTESQTVIFSFLQDPAGGQVSLRTFANDGTITTQTSANGFQPIFDSITLGADTGDKAIAIKTAEVIDDGKITADATGARNYYNNLYPDWSFFLASLDFSNQDNSQYIPFM